MYYLRLAVVEAFGTPSAVIASVAGEKILVLCSVLKIKPLSYVGAGVAVYYIQYDTDAQFVCFADECFQFLRSAVAVGRGEEVGNLVAE